MTVSYKDIGLNSKTLLYPFIHIHSEENKHESYKSNKRPRSIQTVRRRDQKKNSVPAPRQRDDCKPDRPRAQHHPADGLPPHKKARRRRHGRSDARSARRPPHRKLLPSHGGDFPIHRWKDVQQRKGTERTDRVIAKRLEENGLQDTVRRKSRDPVSQA